VDAAAIMTEAALIDGELLPNAPAPIARRVVTLRAEGKSLS
jgi:hypothetical protein